MDLALNILQKLICHKTPNKQTNKQTVNKPNTDTNNTHIHWNPSHT